MPPNRTSESARIAARHRTGSVGAILGWGPTGGRRGTKPQRDFQRENVKQLRQLQQKVKQQQEEKSTPAPHETFKLSQFDNIPSRLHRPQLRCTLTSSSDSDVYRDPVPPPRSGFSTIVFTPPPRSAAAVHGRIAPEPVARGQRPSTGSSARLLSTSSSASGAPGGLVATPSPPQGPRTRGMGVSRSRSSAALRNHSTPAHCGRRGALRTSPSSGCSVSFEDDHPDHYYTDEEDENAEGWEDQAIEEEDDNIGGSSVAALERSWAELRRQRLQRPLRSALSQRGSQSDFSASASAPARHSDARPESADGTAAWWPVRSACDFNPADREGGGEEEAAAAAIPMGYKLVPEAQRLECLANLKSKLVALNEKYARLPLRIETEGYRLLQEKLRSQISETENAVQLFSRPKGVLMEV